MPIIIVGMHRSGTSMITRLYNLCGVYLGPEDVLMKPSEIDNPDGYWENQVITDFNDELLREVGGAWNDPPSLEPGWSQADKFRIFQHRVNAILTDYDQHEPWGWKDPRNMLVLEFWLNIFPDAKLLLCIRNPLEVARSLSTGQVMRDMDYDDAIRLWYDYHRHLLNSIPSQRLIVTHYETYFYDAKSELKRVAELLGMQPTAQMIDEATNTIKRSSKHHNIPDVALERKNIPAETVQTYKAFCSQSGAVYAQMKNDNAYQNNNLLLYTRSLLDQTDALQQQRGDITAESMHYKTQLETLTADISKELTDLHYHRNALQQEFDHLQTEHQTLNQELKHQLVENDHLRQHNENLTRQVQEIQHRHGSLDYELTVIKRSLIYRGVARPIWNIRHALLPENTRRYQIYRRVRRAMRRQTGPDETPSSSRSVFISPTSSIPPEVPRAANVDIHTLTTHEVPKNLSVPVWVKPTTKSEMQHPVVICTIVSKNYIAYARTLMKSIRVHHPKFHLVVMLVDEIDGYYNPDEEPFETIVASELQIPNWMHFAMKYTIMELNTAVKPYLLEVLFDRFSAQKVIYFDPDIVIYNPLVELLELLDNHSVVLTPHLLDPIDDGHSPSELEIMQAGIYNLGFIAMSHRGKWRQMLTWWQSKLYHHCVVDFAANLFVDQRWMDLTPAFIEDTYILHNPGYNVAYWNIKTRTLTKTSDGYQVDGYPLVFFHFSGFLMDNPEPVSKHQNRFKLSMLNEYYRECYSDYGKRLRENEHAKSKNWPYSYGTFANGVPISDVARSSLRETDVAGTRWSNPYDTSSSGNFFDWLTQPADNLPTTLISRYAFTIYKQRFDLQIRFPNPLATNERDFAQWFANSKDDKVIFHAGYVNPIRQVLGQKLLPMPEISCALQTPNAKQNHAQNLTRGVNLIGYAYSETGVGQLLRNTANALGETAFPFSVFPLQEHDISRKQDRTVDRYPAGTPYSTNIFFVNADMTETARKSLNPSVYDHHYNIGVWNWELSTFPVRWQSCFDAYNELWVASTFIRDALAVHTTKPVTAVPITVHVDVDKSITRAHLGLPEHEFIILFAFDALSIIERKNPMAVIRAFEQAFTESERQGKVRLVIKVNNLNLFNEESRQIEAAMKRVNGILINSYLSRLEVHALYNHCNAYISLHRSEGYGLTLAETMFLGKPVVATGYSGNMDFMNPNNSYIVPYTLVELEREYTPYETGNVWADPDIESAAYILRQIYENYEDAKARGANAAAFMREHNDRRVVGEFLAFQLELIIKAQNTAAKA